VLDAACKMQALALEEAKRMGQRYPEINEFKKVPGVGDVGALVYDAYIQTPDRFTRKSALYRYCKLAVTDRSSDGNPLGFKRLDKGGNGELKAMSYRAYLCAMNVKRKNEVRAFYERSLETTKDSSHARLNTQRKIVSVLHGLWQKGEEYRAEKFLGSD